MKRYPYLILTLCLAFGQPYPSYAQQNPEPLNSPELREVLIRLQQLRLAWDEIELRTKVQQQSEQLMERERAISQKELETEKQRSMTEKERAEFYKQAYESVTRKPGFWCGLKQVLTLGLSRCG